MYGDLKHGVFTTRPGTLTHDFFVNLLDMGTVWKKVEGADGLFESTRRGSGEAHWTASNVDLVFGPHSELRALAETYAASDALPLFVRNFVAAWAKVMNLDRYDLR